jgi:hypothetical protein
VYGDENHIGGGQTGEKILYRRGNVLTVNRKYHHSRIRAERRRFHGENGSVQFGGEKSSDIPAVSRPGKIIDGCHFLSSKN